MRFVLAIFLIFAASLNAQTQFPVTFSIGDSSQFGYKRPDISIGAGTEHFSQKWWLNVAGNFSPTDKIAYGNVTRTAVGGNLFWKFNQSFFLGGGGYLQNIIFHDLGSGQNYWTTGPVVAGGWMHDNFRVVVQGQLWRYDHRYNVSGISWTVTNDFKKKFRLGFSQGVYGLSSKSGQNFGTSVLTSVKVGYIF